MFFSTSALKLNITRARRCGLVAAQAGEGGIARCGDRPVEVGRGAEADPGLDAAVVGVEDVAVPLAGRMGARRR